MNKSQNTGNLTAVIGKKEQLQEKLSAEFSGKTKCSVFSEKVPFYSDLSIQDNVQQLRMMTGERDLALFEELLTLSGLKKQRGWTQPFRKDMTGQIRLFGIFEAMITRPDTLIAYDLLAGMETKQREAFAKMADCYRENGGKMVYTAQKLKDVMQLEVEQAIWLFGKEGFIRTDTAAVTAKCAEVSEQADELYRRMEGGEI